MNLKSLKEAVAGSAKAAGSTAASAVQDQLVNAEVEKRKTQILSGINSLNLREKDVEKYSKPDIEHYPVVDGAPSTTAVLAFSPDRTKRLALAKEQVGLWEDALNAAITDAGFDGLEKLLSKGDRVE